MSFTTETHPPWMADEPKLRAWQRWTEWPLPLWITWALFITDYVVRFPVAVHKVRFALHTPFDLAMVALPMPRPLRALRTVAAVTVVNRRLMHTVHRRVAAHTTGAATLIGFAASSPR